MEQKLAKCLLISLSIIILLIAFPTNVSATEVNEINANETQNAAEDSIKKRVGKDFLYLQDRITDTLIVSGDHYVYDEKIIKSLVDTFNIDEFNNFYNCEYTAESLTAEFINLISSYKIEAKTKANTPAYTCNIDAFYAGGWNYDRYYHSSNETNYIANTMANITDSEMLKVFIIGAWGLVDPLHGFTASLLLGWAGDFVNAIRNVNSGCGVVIDFNTISASLLYYEADQRTFPGHF